MDTENVIVTAKNPGSYTGIVCEPPTIANGLQSELNYRTKRPFSGKERLNSFHTKHTHTNTHLSVLLSEIIEKFGKFRVFKL